MTTSLVGSNVGSYKIVRELGVGLMGTVYHATHEGQYWALRVIDDSIVRLTSTTNKLVGDERHPALVRYKEAGADPSVGAYLSTDYMDAHPVSRDRLAGLSSSARVQFLSGLLEGVDWLHKNKLVHGCIKTSNVLMSTRGKKVDGMFIDAGLVYVPNSMNRHRLLRTAYPSMAPELLEAYASGERKTIDAALTSAVDVYAAGLLVAEAFSGRRLFADARSEQELLERKRSMKVEVIGINNPRRHLDLKRLNSVIHSATEPDPNKRLADVSALIEALNACILADETEKTEGAA